MDGWLPLCEEGLGISPRFCVQLPNGRGALLLVAHTALRTNKTLMAFGHSSALCKDKALLAEVSAQQNLPCAAAVGWSRVAQPFCVHPSFTVLSSGTTARNQLCNI